MRAHNKKASTNQPKVAHLPKKTFGAENRNMAAVKTDPDATSGTNVEQKLSAIVFETVYGIIFSFKMSTVNLVEAKANFFKFGDSIS